MELFDKVKCKGFYKKVRDGIYVQLDKDNLVADLINTNLIDVDGNNYGIMEEGIDFAEKTYFEYVQQNFKGVIVGFVDLIVKGYLDVIYEDAVDVGIGVIPEKFYVAKRPKEIVKCAIVYYANNKKHYVPLSEVTDNE